MKNVIMILLIVAFTEQSSLAIETKIIFEHYCAPCHGETGKGDGRYYSFDINPKPGDLTDIEYMRSITDEEIRSCIIDGSDSLGKSNLCPPWGKTIPKEEIDGLVTYVRSFTSSPKFKKKVDISVSQPVKSNRDKNQLPLVFIIVAIILVFLVLIFRYKFRVKPRP